MVGQVVTVKVCENFIRVFYNERQVTAHARVYSKHQDISKDEHKQGLIEIKAAAKDSRAWQVEALKSLGPELGQYLDYLGASPRSLRYELSKLLALSNVYGGDVLCRVVASFLARGLGHGYIYLLTNDRQNVLYIGSTNDLRQRLVHHKHRLIPGFTKKYNVHRLIYFEELQDMRAARERERTLKGMSRAKKDALVEAVNPQRRDLFDELTKSKAKL